MSSYTNPSNKHYARRHRLFLKANRRVKEPYPLNYEKAWGSMDDITAFAVGYVQDTGNKVLVLLNHRKKEKKCLPYRTRFDRDYGKRIARKWKKIGYREGIFLTLTLDPKRFRSFDHAYRCLLRGWNRIATAMRKKFPQIKGYARVVELQESGNPHLHVLIFGADFIAVEWIRKLWEEHYQLGQQINVKKIENDRGAIRYLLKYLLKAFTGKTADEIDKAFIQKAMLWAVNSRGWAVSGSLLFLISYRLIQTGGVSDWVFVGAFSLECVGFSYSEFLEWAGFVT